MDPNLLFTPYQPTELDRRLEACAPGAYPWDDWKRDAVAAGVSPDLAALGRAVMREAYQHGWCEHLKYECGLENPDAAAGMIISAKDQPFLAERRWQWLLITDGLRFDPWKHEEWPEAAPEWNQMLRRWQDEPRTGKALTEENRLLGMAVDFITEFYDLNQLALVDLETHAVGVKDGKATLWADFTVISEERRVIHSGVVRIDLEADGDAAVFERVEEGGNE